MKWAINNKYIHITNLTLTSDNRLIDNSDTKYKEVNTTEKVIIDRDFIKSNYCDYIKLKNCRFETVPKLLYNADIKFMPLVDKKTLIKLCDNYQHVHSNDLYIFKHNNTAIIASEKQICLADYPSDYCGCGIFGELCIKSINLKGVDLSGVTNMWELFSNCEAEKYILDGLDMSHVQNYGYMFYRCYAKTISMKNVKINEKADMTYIFGEIGDFDLYTYNQTLQEQYIHRII